MVVRRGSHPWDIRYMGQDFRGVFRTTCEGFPLLFSSILPWELSTGPPWSEREMQICKSPIPWPTGINASSQVGKEGTVCCRVKSMILYKIRTIWEKRGGHTNRIRKE
jgi:hypothetical protein